MSTFTETIKKFDKVRDYIRDFFIYGYKTRSDYQYKSLRTYDNERRRIESWLGSFIRFDHSKKGKQISISLDSGRLESNPLYKAYQSKSFTDNDILLHFYILDILQNKESLQVEEITDRINEGYGQYFEPQTIRIKLNEYVNEGILSREKQGKAYAYCIPQKGLSTDLVSVMNGNSSLMDGIAFFSQTAPFGVVGHYLLEKLGGKNAMFLFKHYYIVHTLDDTILLSLINAMEEQCFIGIVNFGKKGQDAVLTGIPLKIFESTQTGRKYLILYTINNHFFTLRLDYIKSVATLEKAEQYDRIYQELEEQFPYCWGVSFQSVYSSHPKETLTMTLHIDERSELYILERLKREGRSGTISRIDTNTYSYFIEVSHIKEMIPWIRTFTGRILSLEGSNTSVIQQFYKDIDELQYLYQDF